MEQLRLLLAIFAQASRTEDGRPTKRDLANRSGLSLDVLSTTYSSERSPETIDRIAFAAAALLKVDETQLQRWLAGRREPALQAFIELEQRKMKCTGSGPHLKSAAGLPHGWFDQLVDADLLIPALRRCHACARRAKKRTGHAWAKTLSEAPGLPQAIRRAVLKIQAAGRALTYERLAEQSGLSLFDLRRTLADAGLEKPRRGRTRPSRFRTVKEVTMVAAGEVRRKASEGDF